MRRYVPVERDKCGAVGEKVTFELSLEIWMIRGTELTKIHTIYGMIVQYSIVQDDSR